MSHLIADIFNSYGARILWPFSKKMYSLSLLVITDPVIIILSLISIIISYKGLGHWGYVAAGAFVYILCRALMRLLGKYILRRKLSHVFDIKKIHLLPSMIAGHKLHYIVDDPNYRIIGEINLLLNKVDVSARLKRIDSNIKKHIMESKAARYFMEFTPIYHVNIEKIENGYKAILTDLRYVLRGEFLHHATIIYDNDMNIVDQKFNPYSLNTNLDV
jgi:inner membrane protein